MSTMEGPRVAGDQRDMVAALFDRTADTYDRTGVELFQPIADRLVAELAPRGVRVNVLSPGPTLNVTATS